MEINKPHFTYDRGRPLDIRTSRRPHFTPPPLPLRLPPRAPHFFPGQNILFIDPDCSLQDPHVPPPAGVNHAGRRAKFAWSEGAVAELERIIQHTNCRIVLTSYWRNRATMRTNFNRELLNRGLKPILGRTNVLNGGGRRPAEVLEFIESYLQGPGGAAVNGWCAVDESDFFLKGPYGELRTPHVQTPRAK